MSDGTKIEWTDATWNIITGCSVVSEGCKHCYAMKLAGTRLRNEPSRQGLTIDTKAGPVWNGEVRFNEKWLYQPLQWKRPRRIFVCAHGDLFHEAVTNEMLDQVFAVMALAPQHTFQVLTKRPERMSRYLNAIDPEKNGIHGALRALGIGDLPNYHVGRASTTQASVRIAEGGWPLPNVWPGTSIENRAALHRLEALRYCTGTTRFLSVEPLLGDLGRVDLTGISWVIVGGESGPGARPMHPDWVRSLRDQCKVAGVAFFFKQWGAWGPGCCIEADDDTKYETQEYFNGHWSPCGDDWLTEQDTEILYLLGKKKTGRLLDGRLHDEFPRERA